jgi:hypothetical protein
MSGPRDFGVLFGDHAEGESIPLPLDVARLELVTCTTPLIPGPVPEHVIDDVRSQMQALDTTTAIQRHPLPDLARTLSMVTRDGLSRYMTDQAAGTDRIYVLDFQGPGNWQYVMYGHTNHPLIRITEHIRASEVHGWALVDGWLSPGLENAQPMEQATLNIASLFHPGVHYRERFYSMDFRIGLKIARVVFEIRMGDVADTPEQG